MKNKIISLLANLFLFFLFTSQINASEQAWKIAQEGDKIILIRHSLAPGGGDPRGDESGAGQARGARRADLPGQGAEDGRRDGAVLRLAAQGRGDHGERRVHRVHGRVQLRHACAQAWGGAGRVRLRVCVRWLPGRGAWRRIRKRLMQMCVATK